MLYIQIRYDMPLRFTMPPDITHDMRDALSRDDVTLFFTLPRAITRDMLHAL